MNNPDDGFIAVVRRGVREYFIKVGGPLDLSNAARLQDALLDAMIGTPNRLILDVSAVDTIDARGLDVLVSAHRRAKAAGTELVLWRPNAKLAPILERNGLPSAAASALEWIRGPSAKQPRRPFPSR